jgi:hypothetical protein
VPFRKFADRIKTDFSYLLLEKKWLSKAIV